MLIKQILQKVGLPLTVVGGLVLIGQESIKIFGWLEHGTESELANVFFIIAVLLVLSFVVFYVSESIKFPSFVVAIILGVAAHPFLEPIGHQEVILSVLVGLGATLILFGGGLETPFGNFKKLFSKIILLSFFGLIITAIWFSQTIVWLNQALNMDISFITAILLGVVLASTDPAAIIPVLKKLRFKNHLIKDIIISESAVTDVSGTMLTVVFLGLVTIGTVFTKISQVYQQLFSLTVLKILLVQVSFGVIFGFIGFAFLELMQRWKKSHYREYEADSAFFLFIPIVIFTFAIVFGGSGYLAAFIAGLLFSIKEHLHDTERFFNHLVDAFFKPIIFLLLGSLVNLAELWQYASIGILAAFIFMLVIRPGIVFITLGIFMWIGKEKFSWRELLFISSVRETGAIPAVLLVTIVSLGLPNLEGLVPIGMWVILLTLIIEPLITPWLAKHLGVAETMQDNVPVEFVVAPVVLLVTRGVTFIQRLPFVIDWAKQRGIPNVTVLLCLEDQYTPKRSAEIEQFAKELFTKSDQEISYRFISRIGLLEDNIAAIEQGNHAVAAVFVGRKMLDYRLSQIKHLKMPFFFLD